VWPAELGRLERSAVGNACYRGSGRGQPYLCPDCGKSEGEVLVVLYFNAHYMYELEDEGVEFPWQNLFSGVHVYFRCAGCGEKSMVTELDTKY
jgi:hypothetical protein